MSASEIEKATEDWLVEGLLKNPYELRMVLRELAAAKAELADAESRLQGYAKAVQDLTENQLLQDSATAAVMERAEKAEAELAACREDAERYRWLRHKYANGEMTYFASNCSGNEAEIDEAIDAYLKGKS